MSRRGGWTEASDMPYQAVPHCPAGSPGEGVTCWPVPEVPRNLNTTCCDLGLTDQQEDYLVAFLRTLTDGYFAPKAVHASTPQAMFLTHGKSALCQGAGIVGR